MAHGSDSKEVIEHDLLAPNRTSAIRTFHAIGDIVG